MLVITPTSGSPIAASSAIWPKPRIAASSTSTSVPSGAARISSGIPMSVLKFARERDHAPVRRDQRGDQVLGRRLADRAGDGDHRRAQLAPPRARQRAERRQRVLGGQHDRRRRPSRPARRDEHAPGARLQRARAANSPPSTRVPASPTNRSPGPTSRESITTRSRRAGAAAHEPRAGRLGDPRRVPALTTAQRLARHRHVVERLLAAARELLALLVPLAGDHHHVARLGQRHRAVDRSAGGRRRARRSRPRARQDLGDDRLRVLGARVVGGDERDVGQPRADLAHQRALAAVAVAARAEHRDARGPTASSRAARRTFSSESGVCA